MESRYQLVAEAHQWAIDKLVVGERFGALLVSNHSSGKKMTRYDLASQEDALAACERELASALSDANEYALVYDALLKSKEGTAPALVFRMERRGGAGAAQFAQRYQLKKKLLVGSVSYVPLEDFQPLGAGPAWLV
ncbi:hypothetical protein FB547_12266 [Variovorax beijingensis]|jgi:hypothetical protein|nr:hypothetical protein FB547_12266 [Variovorax beijingensis]